MNKYKYKEDAKGIIINIKHGASKECPGWRSIVYFKGCNFCCPWCGSPGSIPFGKTELTLTTGISFKHFSFLSLIRRQKFLQLK